MTTPAGDRSSEVEEMLCISLRMFEARRNRLKSAGRAAAGRTRRRANRQRVTQTQGYIERIRSLLLTPQSQSAEDTLTRVKGEMAEPRRVKSAR